MIHEGRQRTSIVGTDLGAKRLFEAVVRDPGDQGKYLARYDSGDHLHPGDAGYQAIANAIDLELFKRD